MLLTWHLISPKKKKKKKRRSETWGVSQPQPAAEGAEQDAAGHRRPPGDKVTLTVHTRQHRHLFFFSFLNREGPGGKKSCNFCVNRLRTQVCKRCAVLEEDLKKKQEQKLSLISKLSEFKTANWSNKKKMKLN